MKLTNTNEGRITITVSAPDLTPQFVYVILAGQDFDPTDVGFVVKDVVTNTTKPKEKEMN